VLDDRVYPLVERVAVKRLSRYIKSHLEKLLLVALETAAEGQYCRTSW
jgi:hypothetical protein